MQRPLIVGVMGGGDAAPDDLAQAYRLGQQIARQGWVLLNGGRNAGIMAASARGAWDAGGLTIGILPDADRRHASPYVQIPVLTGMGSARNAINVLTSDVVVACPGGAGTLSEIALALKHGRPVVLLDFDVQELFARHAAEGQLYLAATPEAAVAWIKAHDTSLRRERDLPGS